MIEGCLEWQELGLRPAGAVVSATAAYLEQEDAVAAWMLEKCERDPAARESSANLYASWKAWAEQSGERPGTAKGLTQQLEGRGLERFRDKHARGLTGIRLLRDQVWQN